MKKLLSLLIVLLLMAAGSALADENWHPTGGYLPPISAPIKSKQPAVTISVNSLGIVMFNAEASTISVVRSVENPTTNLEIQWTVSGLEIPYAVLLCNHPELIYYAEYNAYSKQWEALYQVSGIAGEPASLSYCILQPGEYGILVTNSSGTILETSEFTVTGEDYLTAKANQIVNRVCAGLTDEYDKALALYEWLINNNYYDYSYACHGPETVLQQPWTGVCDSYSKAYMLLCNAAGINCERITTTVMRHAWNAVQINGSWYMADPTWDDPGSKKVQQSGYESRCYFAITEELMRYDHYGFTCARDCSSLADNYFTHQFGSQWEERIKDIIQEDSYFTQNESYTLQNVPYTSIYPGRTQYLYPSNQQVVPIIVWVANHMDPIQNGVTVQASYTSGTPSEEGKAGTAPDTLNISWNFLPEPSWDDLITNLVQVEAKAPTCTEPGNRSYYINKLYGRYFEWDEEANEYSEVQENSFVIPATGHENKTAHDAVAATCTEKGNSAYYSCDNCDTYLIQNDDGTFTQVEESDLEIPAINHENKTEYTAAAATCTEPGNTAYYYCKDCDKYFVNGENETFTEIQKDGWVIPAINHAEKTPHEEDPATCTATGTKAYYECKDCHALFTQNTEGAFEPATESSLVIPAINHENKTEYPAAAATCTAAGNTAYYYCKDCDKYLVNGENDTFTEIQKDRWVIPAINHAEKTPHEEDPATCTATGTKAYYECKDCHALFTQNTEGAFEPATEGSLMIPAINHMNRTEYPAAAATCTAAGNTAYYYCKDCDKYLVNGENDSFTEIQKGSWVIPAINHEYKTPHEAVAATCLADGNSAYYICNNCDTYFVKDEDDTFTVIQKNSWIIPAIAHEHKTAHPAVAETCTAAGNTAYFSCDNCDAYFVMDANGAFTVVDKDSWLINPIGHANKTLHQAVAPTCVNKGNTAYYSCNNCDAYFDADGEKITQADWEIAITNVHHAPETENDTLLTYTCKDCGKTFTIEKAQSLRLPASLQTLSKDSFSGISAEAVIVPDACTVIEEGALAIAALKTAVLPVRHETAIGGNLGTEQTVIIYRIIP